MSKNKVDSLRGDRNVTQRQIILKEVEPDVETDDLKKRVKTAKSENSGVQRLLRHLRKAKLEQVQMRHGGVEIGPGDDEQDHDSIDFKFGVSEQKDAKKGFQWGKNENYRKKIHSGIGIPVGSKY